VQAKIELQKPLTIDPVGQVHVAPIKPAEQVVQVVVELQSRQPTIWEEHNTHLPPIST